MADKTEYLVKHVERGDMLCEGKAKKVFATNYAGLVIIEYKDDVIAFNGEKKGQIDSKGILINKISARLFKLLAKNRVKSHFVAELSEREMLCRKLSIIPFEVVVRNVAAGSFSKRLGIEEGTELDTTVFELSYKDDSLGDPLINDYHAVAIGAADWRDLKSIYKIAYNVNTVLSGFFMDRAMRLVDFKIELGKNANGMIFLADEISPDTCRFWDAETSEKPGKDRFRGDLGNIKEAYEEIYKMIAN